MSRYGSRDPKIASSVLAHRVSLSLSISTNNIDILLLPFLLSSGDPEVPGLRETSRTKRRRVCIFQYRSVAYVILSEWGVLRFTQCGFQLSGTKNPLKVVSRKGKFTTKAGRKYICDTMSVDVGR